MIAFILPDVDNNTNAVSISDMYTQYFDAEFTIVRKLGSGEFSEAFAAQMSSDSCVYAVKRTKFPFSGVRDRARQLQEVRILWHVGKHPHCIQLIDAWEQQGHLYLQTELCSRGTLKDYLDVHCNNEQIEEAQIWSFFADIAMVGVILLSPTQ
jgi:serine/threonine protein kinase